MTPFQMTRFNDEWEVEKPYVTNGRYKSSMHKFAGLGWHQRAGEIYFKVIAGLLLAAFIAFAILPTDNWSIRVIVLVASSLPILALGTLFHYVYAEQIQKIYFVDRRDATIIVTQVLDDKQLPYQKHWNGDGYTFRLDDANGLTLQVKSFYPEGKNILSEKISLMSIVKLQPIKPSTKLLSDSLKRKLDEAFAPAGLRETIAIK